MYEHLSSDPAIPQTLHPKFLAICIAISPTAPAAADMTTVSPLFILPTACNPK